MKNKLLKLLMICFVMCLSIGLCMGCNMPGTSEGGSVADVVEEPDPDNYTGSEGYKSVEELYSGFYMVVGTDQNIVVKDQLSGQNKSFNQLLDRQISTFVKELVARLNGVWGGGLDADINIENDYNIKITKTPGTSGGKLDDPQSYKSDLTEDKPFNDIIVINDQNIGVRYTFDAEKNAYVQASEQTLRGLSFYNAISGNGLFEQKKYNVYNGTNVEEKLAYGISNNTGWKNQLDLGETNNIKMAIAKILAYGDANHSGSYNDAIEKIDHLGFLKIQDEENAVVDEVEKIIEYVLSEIIGENALAIDDVSLENFVSDEIPNSYNNAVLAQNYRAYRVLVPYIVDSILNSECYKGEETYKTYPALPRVFTDRFNFPEPEPKEDDEKNSDDELDFDIEGSEDVEFITMDDYKEVKSIVFTPRQDASVVGFMFAFEVKGKDKDGSLKDIKVELDVSFTVVSDGKVILKDETVSGMGAENGRVVINPGVYDGELNDNSAIFNVSNKVKQLLSQGAIEDAGSLPQNGVITVKKYDGTIPFILADLYAEQYSVTANSSGVGSVAGVAQLGGNYIQMKFSIAKAVTLQGETEIPFDGTVLLKLMVGDPIS